MSPLQDVGTVPGTTVMSAGKTLRPSANSAPTPSARPTRRGRCTRGPPQDSCAARSTRSWTPLPTRNRKRALRQALPPAQHALPNAPRRATEPRAKPRAPRGRQPRPEAPLTSQRARRPNTDPSSPPSSPTTAAIVSEISRTEARSVFIGERRHQLAIHTNALLLSLCCSQVHFGPAHAEAVGWNPTSSAQDLISVFIIGEEEA